MTSTQPTKSWTVHKFGGTSVGNADSIRMCIDIIRPLVAGNKVAMVVSAMGGKPKVTDLLLNAVRDAAAGDMEGAQERLKTIRTKHSTAINTLLAGNGEKVQEMLDFLDKHLTDIQDLLRAVSLMRFPHEQMLELVSGYGEIWSATLISHVLQGNGLDFRFLNARDVLKVSEEGDEGDIKIEWEISEDLLFKRIAKDTAENGGITPHYVITGYVASTIDGAATTLKRDGSDYSASIFGKMLKSSAVTIWTDVSGVYSADPRRVPEALIIPEVTYTEASELAYFGAKVIHPKTMAPAIMGNIPIYIRNTFAPEDAGTKISSPVQMDGPNVRKTNAVCGFSSVDDITLINMEGSGMIGVPGIAHRLFGALKSTGISVLFIAQASSEHSICFAIKSQYTDEAKKVIEEAFFYEMNNSVFNKLKIVPNCAIIAAVGETMTNIPGVCGVFFGAMGTAGVNILAISQGCDELNISAVVSASDATRALRAVHAAFWLSALGLSIGVVGTGRVGSAVIQSLLEQTAILEKRYQIKVNIRGVINQRNMLLGEDVSEQLAKKLNSVNDTFVMHRPGAYEGIGTKPIPRDFNFAGLENDLGNMMAASLSADEDDPAFIRNSDVNSDSRHASEEYLTPLNDESNTDSPRTLTRSHSNMSLLDVEIAMTESSTEDSLDVKRGDLTTFFDHMCDGPTPHLIIIDATTSEQVAKMHPEWLLKGAHIVTANRRAISSDLSLYNRVYKAARIRSRMYMSEVTIGASIPVKTTLNDLLSSGDAIKAVVSVMTVSINNVLSLMCESNVTFSEAVRQTAEADLFEKDCFHDLEGIDASSKLLIMCRELGYPLCIEDIEVEKVAKRRPIKELGAVHKTGEFAEEDAYFAKRVKEAAAKKCTLRYVQRLELTPPAELGFERNVNDCKACARLEEVPIGSAHAVTGPVYHFAFHTARYAQTPLVIQGPLSDSMNTASGMVADILRIARGIGAKNVGPGELGKSRDDSVLGV